MFEAQMRLLRRLATPVNLLRVNEPGYEGEPSPDGIQARNGHTVLVTFDDAFLSVAENAVEILQRLNIPAVLFVPVSSLGGTPGWDAGSDAGERLLSPAQLTALPFPLTSIQSHSVTHPHLLEVDARTLCWEITHSRDALEAITGRAVRHFAFPYGEHSREVDAAAFEAGYEMLFSLDPVGSRLRPRAVIGRTCVDPTDGPLEFRLKLVGAYRWMTWASWIKRVLLRRTLPKRGAASYPHTSVPTPQGSILRDKAD